MIYILSISFIILIQLIYINGTDIPFYYKEILYDWNYTTNHSIKFNKKLEWVSLISNKNKIINIRKEQEETTLIQTDLFTQQQNINIHEYLNVTITTLAIILIIYLLYTSINTIMYKHEKQKISYFIAKIIVIITMISYIYNTELLTSILYKTHFTYTDNIYITNQKEITALWIIIIIINLFIYYLKNIIQQNERKVSKFVIYIIIISTNIINENTLIGIEYLYFLLYIEMVLIVIYITKNVNNK